MTALVVAFIVTLGLGFAGRRLGPRLGALDHPDEGGQLKPHVRAVSYLGGPAVAGGIVAGMIVAQQSMKWQAVVVVTGAFVLGLVDDRRGVPPAVRLGTQLALGLVLASGLRSGAFASPAIAWTVTVVLFASILNGVNMIDGMDALAGQSVALSCLAIAVIATRGGHPEALAVVAAGASLGFLVHNAPPASLFLGDNGAYLLGAVLVVSILVGGPTPASLAGSVTCLGVIGLDLGLAVLRRSVGRAPLMTGDRGHFYDQLMVRGLKLEPALLVCLLLQAAFAAAGIAMAEQTTGTALVSFGILWGTVAVLLVVTGFATYRVGDR
jgi:UDP-GlcNAc:undecaprenyl-phosphate GlcNAc-1-phosphate transferase